MPMISKPAPVMRALSKIAVDAVDDRHIGDARGEGLRHCLGDGLHPDRGGADPGQGRGLGRKRARRPLDRPENRPGSDAGRVLPERGERPQMTGDRHDRVEPVRRVIDLAREVYADPHSSSTETSPSVCGLF